MPTEFLQRHTGLKDALSIVFFIVCVIIGTVLINAFIFRSFNVEGPSMEPTLYTGDRLIVNRMPVTWSQLLNKPYIPERGQVIVFKNPAFDSQTHTEEYVVKRVIAYAGERVVLENGVFTVYNEAHPEGFNPDDANHGEPGSPTSGNIPEPGHEVAKESLFVVGDHREGNFSCDSRSCMGDIPLYDVVGPVSLRIYPFTKLRTF